MSYADVGVYYVRHMLVKRPITAARWKEDMVKSASWYGRANKGVLRSPKPLYHTTVFHKNFKPRMTQPCMRGTHIARLGCTLIPPKTPCPTRLSPFTFILTTTL